SLLLHETEFPHPTRCRSDPLRPLDFELCCVVEQELVQLAERERRRQRQRQARREALEIAVVADEGGEVARGKSATRAGELLNREVFSQRLATRFPFLRIALRS